MNKCIICGTEFIPGSQKKHVDCCCHSCVMVKLHRQKVYAGKSHFEHGYNGSEKRRRELSEISKRRRLIKGARGFNSEHSDRLRNRDNLLARYANNLDSIRYLYVAKFGNSLKLGSSNNTDRRLNNLGGYIPILLIKGTTKDIAQLEFETFVEFENFTLLDDTGSYYTEFLDPSIELSLLTYLCERVDNNLYKIWE